MSMLLNKLRRLGMGSDYLQRASNVIYLLSGRFDTVEDYLLIGDLQSAARHLYSRYQQLKQNEHN